MIITEKKYIVENMTFITEFLKEKMDSLKRVIHSEDEKVSYKIIALAFRMAYELKFGYYPPTEVEREFHEQFRKEIELNL